MSVENILKTGFRTWFKAVKMTPGHYLTLAKIFYNHKTTGCGWKNQINELLASNKEKLTPFIEEFEYLIDYHFGTTLFGTQAYIDKHYRRDIDDLLDELNEIVNKTIKGAAKGELN